MKEDALELIDWALKDISPDPHEPICIRMGIEREGHFFPTQLMTPVRPGHIEKWQSHLRDRMSWIADEMHEAMHDDPELPVQRIYHDTAGTFLMELTTQPLPPRRAAKAVLAIGGEMERLGEGLGLDAGGFGTISAKALERLGNYAPSAMKNYAQEVFMAPNPETGEIEPMLVGRGQHANVSLWMGNIPLFSGQSPYDWPGHTLGAACMQAGMDMLPGMVLPTRAGNYYRIAANAESSVQSLSHTLDSKAGEAMNWTQTYSPPRDDDDVIASLRPPIPETIRIEFRHPAADADPYDVALSAALPLAKAVLGHARLDPATGKVALDDSGVPQFDCDGIRLGQGRAMPRSEEEAAQLFNTPDNPNFTLLNELAERKIAQAQAKDEAEHSAASGESLRKAMKLRGIGTKLHAAYCSEYGLESAMTGTGTPKARGMD